MYKKNIALLAIGLSAIMSSCESKTESSTTQTSSQQPAAADQSNSHKGTVKEVLQTTSYTYLLLVDNNKEQWVAVPSMQAKAGDTYYYEGGLQMNKFESKELKRTFETVLFLEKVGTDAASAKVAPKGSSTDTAAPTATAGTEMSAPTSQQYTRTPPAIEKKQVKISAVKGGITIGELFAKKESFAGKTVKIKGEVTKFTPAVMNKNWVHIQDGTEDKGKFDLVITTEKEVKLGDKIIFEGKIGLNKDLGYGYFFDVIMEDANVIK
ncbi:MAG: hypothetical protein WCG87_12285 [Bacteroidota bacterium]